MKKAEETGQLIAYGRSFLANVSYLGIVRHSFFLLTFDALDEQPDLPFRLRENIPLNTPEPESFYSKESADGYITYPFSEKFKKTKEYKKLQKA